MDPTGLNAATYIRAATGPAPTELVGEYLKAVIDATRSLNRGNADISSRGSGGWREQATTLADGEITLTCRYDAEDVELGLLMTAALDNTKVDVAFLDYAEGDYKGTIGRYNVASEEWSQPLEEGQEISFTLSVNRKPVSITGTHPA